LFLITVGHDLIERDSTAIPWPDENGFASTSCSPASRPFACFKIGNFIEISMMSRAVLLLSVVVVVLSSPERVLIPTGPRFTISIPVMLVLP